MSHPLKASMSERVHAYFTASPYYSTDIQAAWEDGKRRLRSIIQEQSKALEELTLDDYCRATGSVVNS